MLPNIPNRTQLRTHLCTKLTMTDSLNEWCTHMYNQGQWHIYWSVHNTSVHNTSVHNTSVHNTSVHNTSVHNTSVHSLSQPLRHIYLLSRTFFCVNTLFLFVCIIHFLSSHCFKRFWIYVHSSKSVQICLFFIMFNIVFIYESSPFVFFYKVYVYIILLFIWRHGVYIWVT